MISTKKQMSNQPTAVHFRPHHTWNPRPTLMVHFLGSFTIQFTSYAWESAGILLFLDKYPPAPINKVCPIESRTTTAQQPRQKQNTVYLRVYSRRFNNCKQFMTQHRWHSAWAALGLRLLWCPAASIVLENKLCTGANGLLMEYLKLRTKPSKVLKGGLLCRFVGNLFKENTRKTNFS